ncbi:MAG: UDP-3-O-(3-hydroxymyristoyl)glucosamine N-acyltransferase [Halieaceae bacterium]|nr:UDP-3-O-(3-hydroxymyristoyl)glucosamine N-acyltransferase [Halieaceae bacterium]
MFTLGELAEKLDLEVSGDSDRIIDGLATLAGAGPRDLTFLTDKKYLPQLADSKAGAVIIDPELALRSPLDCLIARSPYVAYARASQLFDTSGSTTAGVHPTAVVSCDAVVDPGATIGPNVVIEAGAVVECSVEVGASAYVGRGSVLGAGTRIYPSVVIYGNVHLGKNCIVHSQAVLGADGFGFAPGPSGWEKICQLGGVRIGDRVEIGAGTTIDRGALENTIIEDGVILDNLVHIAHNCSIGKNTAIAACTGVAGSTKIGANCTLAGKVGVVGHADICDNVHLSGMSMVTKSITEPGSYSSGTPISPTRDWRRSAVRFSQLDSIYQRLVALEKQLK